MKHSDLKVGMKVKRVSNFHPKYYTSTKGNISTVSIIGNYLFSTVEDWDTGTIWDAEFFEPVQEISGEVQMQKIDINKKYRTRCGYPARVLCVDRDDKNYPVVALFGEGDMMHSFSADGKYFIGGEHKYDLIEVSPWEGFKKDDKVMVRDYEWDTWAPRYFSHVEDGLPHTFINGTTSFSNEHKATNEWKYCRKPNQKELES